METTKQQNTTFPDVAVIVLNYNGQRFLQQCFSALAQTDYPADRLELILADNGSRDGSVEFIKTNFPQVRIIENKANLGFAEGNNRAIRATRTPYLVLLNNDTEVKPGWLKPLVAEAEEHPEVGGCTAKLLFYYRRLPLVLSIVEGSFCPTVALGVADNRTLGVMVGAVEVKPGGTGAEVEFKNGFWGIEKSPRGSGQWSGAEGVLALPVAATGEPLEVKIQILSGPPEPLPPARLQVSAGGVQLGEFTVGSNQVELAITVPAELLAGLPELVQNAGSELLANGYGRDRGSELPDNSGRYNHPEQVFAMCGAGMLLKRRMLADIGLLDGRFFMYYEDTDLSWRANLAGWKLRFVPEAEIRHIHCGSSREGSAFFVYHAERNRLLLLIKNAPARLVFSQLWAFFQNRLINPLDKRVRLKLFLNILALLPVMLGQRWKIRKAARVPDQAILGWFVKE